MAWLHMELVLIFITKPSQIGQNGLEAAADVPLAGKNHMKKIVQLNISYDKILKTLLSHSFQTSL